MLTLVDLRGYAGDPRARLPRAAFDREAERAAVREIVAAVREGGDEAALGFQERFGARPRALRVPSDEIQEARGACGERLLGALEEARERIHNYHWNQFDHTATGKWDTGGIGSFTGEMVRPLRRVGCYVPGGRAAYPSTVLMTAVPARIAGVEDVVVCVPPGPAGTVHPATLAACAIAGVDEVYALGGAQAIAALAYGTDTIARVDKVVGPGNIWVTVAKHEVAMDCGVDSFAGPTEIVIIADDSAPPRMVAADLVAQAEHDPLATALLITPSERLADEVNAALPAECAEATRRADIEKALADQGRAVLVDDLERAVEVAASFAPEHLEVLVHDAWLWALRARSAGAIFVGPYSPVAIGDYVAGTNHVLPTAGSARFASPLGVRDFLRATAIVAFDRDGLGRVAPALFALAEAEGLDAHARAVRVRLE